MSSQDGLLPCPACGRHVQPDATACPFCGTTTSGRARPSEESFEERASRTLYGAAPPPREQVEFPALAYGAPPVPRQQLDHVLAPAYGGAPAMGEPRRAWVLIVVIAAIVALAVGALAAVWLGAV
jgi:hypothetical protein